MVTITLCMTQSFACKESGLVSMAVTACRLQAQANLDLNPSPAILTVSTQCRPGLYTKLLSCSSHSPHLFKKEF